MSNRHHNSKVIAVDIGTTSTKTLAVESDGTVLASYDVEYPLVSRKPGEAVQDPEQIYEAVMEAIPGVISKAGLRAADIVAVSFSSAMHSLIAVDGQHKPLTPCITWADNRSTAYVERLNQDMNGHQIYINTGTPIHPMSPLLKIMWLRDHEPDLFAQAEKFIGIKEYIFAKWFHSYIIDYSLASATGLFHLRSLAWDDLALQTAGITADKLSEPVDTTHYLQGLSEADAKQLGLEQNTPFVLGASDGVLANLGIGALERGVFAVTIGTSGAVRAVVREPQTDPNRRLFCYALAQDYWVIGGPINNGGVVLRWVRDQVAAQAAEEARRMGIDPYEKLSAIAGEAPAGSAGLLCLPLFSGERAPDWNADARGVYFGLSLYHETKHMIRAAMEGVMFRIGAVVAAVEEFAGTAKQIRASGGFARSPLWVQMMADVLGSPVTIPATVQSSGLGAAALGFKAVGIMDRLEDVQQWVSRGHLLYPDKHNEAVYQELIAISNRVYDGLVESFYDIAAFQAKSSEG